MGARYECAYGDAIRYYMSPFQGWMFWGHCFRMAMPYAIMFRPFRAVCLVFFVSYGDAIRYYVSPFQG
jgi:hypothetical protein